MIVAGSASPLLLSSAGGYNLTKSLRFRSSATAWLSRTISSNGSATTWTYSTWIKRGTLGTAQDGFIEARVDGLNNTEISFTSSDTLSLTSFNGGSTVYSLTTTQVFRDPSAWYHFVIQVDTTQATSSNRVRLYVNGSQVTAFSSATYPSQNATTYISQTSATHNIGRWPSPTQYFDGYMAEVNFIDGQALTPSSFGSTNAATGVWQPIKYTGTYGTNGFYLPFTDTTSTTTISEDFSGNNNDWTSNNISLTAGSTYDSMTDVPTLTSLTVANYPTFNAVNSNATLSRANLQSLSSTTSWFDAIATMAFPVGTGKWYVEATNTSNSYECIFGVTNTTIQAGSTDNYRCGYSSAGQINRGGYGQGDTTGVATYTVNDVIGMAVDCSAGTVSFYKNNTLINTTTATDFTIKELIAFTRQNNAGFNINFGQRPFAYTPPSGFVALNTFNLPTSTIGATASTQANDYFDATLYTGTGSAQSITNSGSMQPDLVWVKGRDAAKNHTLVDSVRGATKNLVSNSTNDEGTWSSITAFNSNGFTLGTDANENGNGNTFVAWQWKANGTGSSNTDGTITSTVSANTTAGFSIVTYTGNQSAGATVGHGLGVAPSMIIIKSRGAVTSWPVYHTSLGATQWILLNSTNSATTSSQEFNNTAPTSTVFSIGNSSSNSNQASTYVAYCFSEVAGYSRFGSYTGNGSSDGPFVFCGFRPRYLLVKRTDSAGFNWVTVDAARDTYNVTGNLLLPNTSGAESSAPPLFDFLSNGFKVRDSGTGLNGNGGTYIYAAFATYPFKFSLAR